MKGMDMSTGSLFAMQMAVNGVAAGREVRYDAPRARKSDPATSHQAAASMQEAAQAHREQILGFLGAQGATGATGNEIDRALGWRSATANRRLKELSNAGLVLDSGERRPTETGRLATVYVLAPLAYSAADIVRP